MTDVKGYKIIKKIKEEIMPFFEVLGHSMGVIMFDDGRDLKI